MLTKLVYYSLVLYFLDKGVEQVFALHGARHVPMIASLFLGILYAVMIGLFRLEVRMQNEGMRILILYTLVPRFIPLVLYVWLCGAIILITSPIFFPLLAVGVAYGYQIGAFTVAYLSSIGPILAAAIVFIIVVFRYC